MTGPGLSRELGYDWAGKQGRELGYDWAGKQGRELGRFRRGLADWALSQRTGPGLSTGQGCCCYRAGSYGSADWAGKQGTGQGLCMVQAFGPRVATGAFVGHPLALGAL